MKAKDYAASRKKEGQSIVLRLWPYLYVCSLAVLGFIDQRLIYSISDYLASPDMRDGFSPLRLWEGSSGGIEFCIIAFVSTVLCLHLRKIANFTKSNTGSFHAMLVLIFFLLFWLPLTVLLNDIFSTEAKIIGGQLSGLLNGTVVRSQDSLGIKAIASNDAIAFVASTSQLAVILCQWLLFIIFTKMYVFSPSILLRRDGEGLSLGYKFWREFTGDRHLSWNEIKRVSIDTITGQKFLCIETQKDRFKIRWSDLKETEDPTDLLSEIKTHVPNVSTGDGASKDSIDETANQYTELWLKYFSASSQRKRTSSLSSNESLNNGRYILAGELGQGGQGTAYLASYADQSDASVVLKEYILPVHRGEVILQQSISKLNREAEILKQIHHPNIVQLKDTFIEDHRGYLVLEYVEGNVLKDLVKNNGPQPESLVIDIAIQVCYALEYLHNMDPPVVHRDLTPDNLILQPDGNVKLVDFNVAQQLEPSATSTVVGKHAYIPPEQFRGKPSKQSDIFALGGTLHYLLTGQEPEPLSVSHPKSLEKSTSSELDEIVARATALEQSKRFVDAAEFREALQALKPKTINTKSEVTYEKR